MATYKDLQDRIALDYLNRMTLVPEIKRAINNSIKLVEAQRFWFNEAQGTLTAVANQTYVSVPADFLSLDRLELTRGSADYALSEQPFDWVRDMNATRASGAPTHFAYYQDRFELAVRPDSAYLLPVYYLKSLPALSADSDSNAWTNEAGNLIAHLACVELLSGVLQADDKAIKRHAAAAQLARSELDMRNDTRLLRRIRATSF